MKARRNCLVLHKSEWDRLRRRHDAEINDQKEEYLRSITEQSQNWMKLWPDTTQGHMYQMAKQKESEHARVKKIVKEFCLKKKNETTADAIERAKELIFADSNYGRQLLSALITSKTLEERDVQIKLQEEIKGKTTALKDKEPKACSLIDSRQMEKNEIASKLQNKQIATEIAKHNAVRFEMQKEKRKKEKCKLKLEDASFVDQLTKKNTEIESKRLYLEKQAMKEYEMQNKNIKDFRTKREEQDEIRREIWRKYQERIKCREKIVVDKIHNEKYNSPHKQKLFKTIQYSEENKIKKYDEFVEKGIQRCLDRSNKQEQKEMENKISAFKERKLLYGQYKIQAELENRRRMRSKLDCCRQCILTKCRGKPKQEDCTTKELELHTDDNTAPSFLLPNNKHLEELKKHRQPASWSALNAAHDQFYQHASKTLQECHYKNAARKVVDDYQRENRLEPKAFRINNYY